MGCNSSKQPKAAQPATADDKPQLADEAKSESKGAPKQQGLKAGDEVVVSVNGGYDAEVLRCTTTDVLVKKKDGKEQWVEIEDILARSTTPPLLSEVKVGAEVTTVLGTAGTVVKRTTTEVCIKDAEGKESWVGIEDITVVQVSILSAQGLHNADWIGKSDPYCACMIEGKPNTKVQTKTVTDRLDPVWEFEAGLVNYAKGDALNFEVYDQDTLKKDDFLGRVTIKSEEFHATGFYGDVPLLDGKGESGSRGTIKVKIEVKHCAPDASEEPAAAEDEGPAVSEVPNSKKSCCC